MTRALLAALVAATAISCSLFSSPAPLRRLRLQWSDPTTALRVACVVSVGVRAPDGAMHDASGSANQGGTVGALAVSLCHSLANDGCEAVVHEGVDEGDQLARAMHKVVELPEGWTFVYMRNEVARGESTARLVVSLEAAR